MPRVGAPCRPSGSMGTLDKWRPSLLAPYVRRLAVLLRALQTLQASCCPRHMAGCRLVIMSTKSQPSRVGGEATSWAARARRCQLSRWMCCRAREEQRPLISISSSPRGTQWPRLEGRKQACKCAPRLLCSQERTWKLRKESVTLRLEELTLQLQG